MLAGFLLAAFPLTSLLVGIADAASAPSASPQAPSSTGIISAQGTKFVDKNCHEYVYSGANVWQIIEAAAGSDDGSSASVPQMFSNAKAVGMNVIRLFPFGILPTLTLQTSPGVFNQKNWDALDSVIKQASDADIKLVLPFSDNWGYTNGKFEFVAWGGKTDPDAFYTDPNIKNLYKNTIKAIVTHVNPQTGRAYKDEPAIFSWNLMNEMRSACNTSFPNVSCTATATKYMQSWIDEMAAYVKSVDPNHMLTVGEEGFYASGDPKAQQYNPGSSFAVSTGQDFPSNHRSPNIDFAATHIWVDNWQVNDTFCRQKPSCGPAFITNWIKAHADDATSLRKPLVVEEHGNNDFGNKNNYAVRNPQFTAAYAQYLQALKDDTTNVKGIAFWQWQYSDQVDPHAVDFGYSVFSNDSTWSSTIAPSFQPTQAFLAAKKAVPGCVPGATRAQSQLAPVASAGRKLLAAAD